MPSPVAYATLTDIAAEIAEIGTNIVVLRSMVPEVSHPHDERWEILRSLGYEARALSQWHSAAEQAVELAEKQLARVDQLECN